MSGTIPPRSSNLISPIKLPITAESTKAYQLFLQDADSNRDGVLTKQEVDTQMQKYFQQINQSGNNVDNLLDAKATAGLRVQANFERFARAANMYPDINSPDDVKTVSTKDIDAVAKLGDQNSTTITLNDLKALRDTNEIKLKTVEEKTDTVLDEFFSKAAKDTNGVSLFDRFKNMKNEDGTLTLDVDGNGRVDNSDLQKLKEANHNHEIRQTPATAKAKKAIEKLMGTLIVNQESINPVGTGIKLALDMDNNGSISSYDGAFVAKNLSRVTLPISSGRVPS